MPFVKYHLPALLYAVLIIIVSSQPNLHTGGFDLPGLDKAAHFLEYAIFAILVFRSFSHLSNKMHIDHTFFISLLSIIIFAILDEFYQQYIPGRNSDVVDILFDLSGSALILFLLWQRAKSKSSNIRQ